MIDIAAGFTAPWPRDYLPKESSLGLALPLIVDGAFVLIRKYP
jgi:hypothetical protein